MTLARFADTINDLHIWSLAVNKMNQQSRRTGKIAGFRLSNCPYDQHSLDWDTRDIKEEIRKIYKRK